jgi:hypothetical protein
MQFMQLASLNSKHDAAQAGGGVCCRAPEQAVDERALARAGAADDAAARAGRHFHAQPAQHQRQALAVAHLHILEIHLRQQPQQPKDLTFPADLWGAAQASAPSGRLVG